jgi:hypothetical protein
MYVSSTPDDEAMMSDHLECHETGYGAKLGPDLKALKKACEWIERCTSDRMKRATAEFIYDRYVRHPPARWPGS